jgi:pSer/pThr/pTyr-binding forkhead associated (FHA) protein
VFERGFYVVHDLQSANGTYLNGRRISVAPLTGGAELKMGGSRGLFDDEPDEVPRGTVMGRENPGQPVKPDTAEMPPEDWQTHAHQKAARRPDYAAAPMKTRMGPRREGGDSLGDTSLMEEAGDDSEPESRSRPPRPLDGKRFEIQRGVPWGELTSVKGEDGTPRLFYRRTLDIVGFVAAAVSILVLLAGAVVSVLLAVDSRPVLAGTAMGITLLFTVGILLLVPRRGLTVLGDAEGTTLAMQITELTLPGLPGLTFEVRAPDGSTIGYLRKHTLGSFPSRRWSILGPREERIGIAKEDGLIRPFFRRVLGDCFGSLTTDYRVVAGRATICTLSRRTAVRALHTVTIEAGASPPPDARLLLAFAFVVDLVEKSR